MLVEVFQHDFNDNDNINFPTFYTIQIINLVIWKNKMISKYYPKVNKI